MRRSNLLFAAAWLVIAAASLLHSQSAGLNILGKKTDQGDIVYYQMYIDSPYTKTSDVMFKLPKPAVTVMVYRNGIRQRSVVDYTLAADKVIFKTASTPQPSDVIVIDFVAQ